MPLFQHPDMSMYADIDQDQPPTSSNSISNSTLNQQQQVWASSNCMPVQTIAIEQKAPVCLSPKSMSVLHMQQTGHSQHLNNRHSQTTLHHMSVDISKYHPTDMRKSHSTANSMQVLPADTCNNGLKPNSSIAHMESLYKQAKQTSSIAQLESLYRQAKETSRVLSFTLGTAETGVRLAAKPICESPVYSTLSSNHIHNWPKILRNSLLSLVSVWFLPAQFVVQSTQTQHKHMVSNNKSWQHAKVSISYLYKFFLLLLKFK